MNDSKKLTPPTKKGKDVVYDFFQGASSVIPSLFIPGGGFAGVIFSQLFVSPFQKRLKSWMEMVVKELEELKKSDVVRWEDLEGNERFLTVLIQCTQAAMRQHQQEKLTLLLNALSNTAQQNRIEEDLESTFVRHIDELTSTHFILLTFLYENKKKLANIQDYEGLLKRFSEDREVQIGREEFRPFCKDLDSRLLVRFSKYMGEFEGVYNPGVKLREGDDNMPSHMVTDLGLKLLNLVKDHKKNDEKEVGKK